MSTAPVSLNGLSPEQKAKEQYDSYIKYGRMLETMLKRLGAKLG